MTAAPALHAPVSMYPRVSSPEVRGPNVPRSSVHALPKITGYEKKTADAGCTQNRDLSKSDPLSLSASVFK